ncbi:MAG: hypothetical protein KH301_10035 [Brachyspira sp.]|nr:hypothetical protein [Brachyspira sp.]
MQQNGVFDLLKMLELSIDESFPIIPGRYVVVKPKEIETLIDRIYASLPVEVQEARAFLRRRDELQLEAQQKAEKIIADAQMEADRKLSEADFIKAVEREGIRIRNQVQEDCEEIKRKALEDAENIRIQATEDAMKTKEGAEIYAEQVLTNLEKDLAQLQQVVKNGQVYMEKLRSESYGSSYDSNYSSSANATSNYVIK